MNAWKRVSTALTLAAVFTCAHLLAQAPAGAQGGADKVAAFKQALQQGLAKARNYEWIETTIISLKGEEKARKQNRCYYGADGKVQKTPLDKEAPAKEAGGGGRRGGRVKEKIVENKKEEMQEYMQRAAALIHSYVPPDPAKIQAAKDAGRVTVTPQGGGRTSLAISEYLQPGDTLTIDLDAAANTLLSLGVNSYLDKPDQPVTLAVKMATLPDGALYAAETTLEAKAKNIRVVTENSGYKALSK